MRIRSVLRFVPHFLRHSLPPALAFAFALALVVACSGQTEGEACSPANGNSADCANNLVCKFETGVNGFRCCPADDTRSTTVTCGVHASGIVADSAAPDLTDGDAEAGAGSLDGAPADVAVGDAANSTTDDAADSTVAPEASTNDAQAETGADAAAE
jgi:hypothetical protein